MGNAWRRARIYGIALLIAGAAATLVPAGTASADEVGPPKVPAPSRTDLGGLGSCGIPIHQQAYVEAYGPRSLDGVNVREVVSSRTTGDAETTSRSSFRSRIAPAASSTPAADGRRSRRRSSGADELPANGRVTDVVSAPLRPGENSYKVVVSATYREDLTPIITSDETSANKITRQ